MSDEPATGEGARLLACRACGNRVARSVRRCPACGAREPTSDAAPAPAARPTTRPARRAQSWRLGAALLGAALVGAAASAVIFVALRPSAAPRPMERPAPPVPALAPATEPARAAPAIERPSEPSRSRGRADWLFFFRPGDQLVRMADDTAMGMVIRTVPRHAFPDGTVGPAYVLQLPDGAGQHVLDADEVERGGRLQ
jgi:hypothetical protein